MSGPLLSTLTVITPSQVTSNVEYTNFFRSNSSANKLYRTFPYWVVATNYYPWEGFPTHLALSSTLGRAFPWSVGPIRAMEQVVGVEPTPSAWKAPILATIRYLQIWVERWDLNPRHPESQSGALPTELLTTYY